MSLGHKTLTYLRDLENAMLHRVLAALLVIIALSVPAAAQCDGRWLEGPEFGRAGLGTNAYVRAAVEWDADGPGPEPTRLVVGGGYGPGGHAFLATWDGEAFRLFGTLPLVGAHVRALAVYQGRLFVGLFGPTQTSPFVYEWDGSTLQPHATGAGGVLAMTVAHDCLYVGGYFTSIAGVAANGIARWNGTSWSGVGASGYGTFALATTANGDVVAGGLQWGVARFNGAAWTALANSVDSRVRSLVELSDGSIVAGGLFTSINGVAANNIARWDGSTWRTLGAGSTASVRALTVRDGRVLAAMASRSVPGGQAFQLGDWSEADGWNEVGGELIGPTSGFGPGDDGGPYVFRHVDGRLFVGGGFDIAGPYSAQRAALLNGDQWVSYGANFDGSVNEFLVHNGALYAAGSFTRTPGGVAANRVARWNGASWAPLADGLNGTVKDIEPFGDFLLASGTFSASGSRITGPVALWDGSSWHAFGDMNPNITGKLAAAGSRVYILGPGGFRYWDDEVSTSWSPVSSLGFFTTINDLTSYNGTIYVGGQFIDSANSPHARIVRWTGSSWVLNWDDSFQRYTYSVDHMWSLPGHGLVFSGSGFGHAMLWPGTPLQFPELWEYSRYPALLSAVASGSSGRAVANGWFHWANSDTPVNQIALLENGVGRPMGGGRAIGSSIAFFGNEVAFNGGDPSLYSDITTVWSRWTFDGTPWFAQQPESAAAPCNQPVTLSVIPASGYDPLSFRWQLQDPTQPSGWRDLADGPLVISGREVAMIADSTTPALTVTPLLDFAPPFLRAVVSNTCGSTPSQPATLAITGCAAICDADVNCDGALNGFDIEAMQQAVAGDLSNFCQADPDFNHDGAANGFDIEAVERGVNGFPCP